MATDGWISRKRKRTVKEHGPKASSFAPPPLLSTTHDGDDASPSSPPTATIPLSLLPHLGWTKLSARHQHQPRKRKINNWNRGELVERVSGRAVFFVHDPQPGGGSTSEKDESKIWFQGRFFPSVAGRGGNSRQSPASVLSDLIACSPSLPADRTTTNTSWGLLAVQRELADECLACSEGGYRELDLTFIRHTDATSTRKKNAVRWLAQDIVWTGGNMMHLSTDLYSPSSLSSDEPGVKFEPRKLMEGGRAMEVAAKYFPSMMKRLHIQSVTNESEPNADAMVVIGDMEVVAPKSFVKTRNNWMAYSDDNDDGLWRDE